MRYRRGWRRKRLRGSAEWSGNEQPRRPRKFGKLETKRAGLASAFEAAITAGKPVLTTVSDGHYDAWRALAPNAISLPADVAAIHAWWRAVRS